MEANRSQSRELYHQIYTQQLHVREGLRGSGQILTQHNSSKLEGENRIALLPVDPHTPADCVI